LVATQGRALYVDAEMGQEMFARRAWEMTGGRVPPYEYADALGADIARAEVVTELARRIDQTEANLVVLDSLKALSPSKDENSNTDMGPVMQSLIRVSRDTRAAIVLIHHNGKSGSFRGATVIRDQCDALFSLAKAGAGFKLWVPDNGKDPRYAPKPEPVHLAIDMKAGGIAKSEGHPEAEEGQRRGRPPVAVLKVRASIVAALPAQSRADVGRKIDLDPKNGTLRRAWDGLIEDDEIERVGDVWRPVPQMSTALGTGGFGTPETTGDTGNPPDGVPVLFDTPDAPGWGANIGARATDGGAA